MKEILANYDQELPDSQEGLTIVFYPTSIPLKKRWRNNGLSADFMADYFATFFTSNNDTDTKIDLKTEIKGAVSFIANELLENAMKFNDENSPIPIGIRLQMHGNRLVFLATNSLNHQKKQQLVAFIHELTHNDPNDLYIEQLEKNATEENTGGSGLGILTMINDYEAKVGWKVETVSADIQTVTTMVQLIVY
jgi:hypothetical protein